MSAESTLGTAHAEIVVELTKMTGDITREKTLVSSLGPSFEQTYVKMDAAQKRATVQAIKLTDQIGKTREEIRLQGLEAKGAAPEALELFIARDLNTRRRRCKRRDYPPAPMPLQCAGFPLRSAILWWVCRAASGH